MIDRSKEELIPISRVPERLPPKPSGRPWSVHAVRCWARVGLSGVNLEICNVGNSVYTSLEAVARFNEAVARARGPKEPAPGPGPDHEAAERYLESIGI